MKEDGYLSVGQLARKVGTTVRTIQYYDQQGLLTPSAKGPGNQRLYTASDESALYRILTLKYLGLSLADIGERKDSMDEVDSFQRLLSDTMAALEEDFQNLVLRLSVLRALFNNVAADRAIDWRKLARTIDEEQGENGFFWHHIAAVDKFPESAEDARGSEGHRIAVAQWHELIADTISLMAERVAPDDPRAAELAERYRELESGQLGTLGQMFVLAESMTPHSGDPGSFDVLRDSVMGFLEEAMAANPEEGPR